MDSIIANVREGNIQETLLWLENIENDVNQGDEHSFTLLHWAARENRRAIVELLYNRGARINATNLGDDTALHLAAAHGHFEIVQFLLERHPFSLDVGNEHGNTPLHYACFWNFENICEYLIRNGANVTQENKYQKTPLEVCSSKLSLYLTQLAGSLGQNTEVRREYKDLRYLWEKTRARHTSLYPADGEPLNANDVEVDITLEPCGTGHSAEVMRGIYKKSQIVIKLLKVNASERNQRDFLEELRKLRIFNHPNILPVLGTVKHTPKLCLVSDYMSNGSLYQILHHPQFMMDFSQRQALRFALDIARAMEFLHSPELKVPGFRLNSKHILIHEDVARIGLSSEVDNGMGALTAASGNLSNAPAYADQENLTARLNMADYKFSFHERAREYDPAWMSPEALQKKPTDINAQASDMWSFGVILWELQMREIPFGNVEAMILGMQIATEGLRLSYSSVSNTRMTRLMKLCMNDDPGKRPRFDMLLNVLDKMRESAE